jgi:hypothetical protein
LLLGGQYLSANSSVMVVAVKRISYNNSLHNWFKFLQTALALVAT